MCILMGFNPKVKIGITELFKVFSLDGMVGEMLRLWWSQELGTDGNNMLHTFEMCSVF